ncbi:MAG: sigma-70 family RNA polymerase sigma factor [Oscillospiraceae bacterium]|nr:sigma-70 family RNA polymerase sigma factor [Oscillospiraceae bacterium]
MTAKEYLMQYRDAMRRTQAITEHIADLRAMCEQLRTEDGHKIELDKAVAELVDAERRAAGEVDRLAELEQEIVQTISRTAEPYRTLLYERYINGKTWEQIAVAMYYSYRGVTKMHGRALQALKECIEVPTPSVL